MKIVHRGKIAESPWIELKRVAYETDEGLALTWDYIERKNARSSVLVLPKFKDSGDLLFVRQYRVVFDAYVIGFPAGVIDGDEDVESCALRELKEETGYSGQASDVSPPLTLNSALVKETARCVAVTLEDDASPEPQELEPSERIEVYRVKRAEIGDFFARAVERGDLIAGGLWHLWLAASWL